MKPSGSTRLTISSVTFIRRTEVRGTSTFQADGRPAVSQARLQIEAKSPGGGRSGHGCFASDHAAAKKSLSLIERLLNAGASVCQSAAWLAPWLCRDLGIVACRRQ
jgi:hypothetical protein